MNYWLDGRACWPGLKTGLYLRSNALSWLPTKYLSREQNLEAGKEP